MVYMNLMIIIFVSELYDVTSRNTPMNFLDIAGQ